MSPFAAPYELKRAIQDLLDEYNKTKDLYTVDFINEIEHLKEVYEPVKNRL